MLVEGAYVMGLGRSEVWRMLTDPETLARCTPGCQEMTVIDEGVFAVTMKVGVAAISGTYKGKMQLCDLDPPKGFRIVVHGTGPIGVMGVDSKIRLEEVPAGTEIRYAFESKIGGVMAGLGQRALIPIAKFLIKQFLDNLSKEKPTAPSDVEQRRTCLET